MSKLLQAMQKNMDAMRRIAAVIGMPSTDPGAVADRVLADLDELAQRRAEYIAPPRAVNAECGRECYVIGGGFISEDPDCQVHRRRPLEMAATTGEEA